MAQNISKKLSFIGENIKKIRQAKRISQAEFATLFNLARPSIGAYEEGRSEPKIDTIIQMATYFNISIDVLLTRKLTVSEIYSVGILNQKLNKAHKLESTTSNKDWLSKTEGIGLVEVKNYLNYIVSHKTGDFVKSLPQINLPVDKSLNYRAFEMNGSEMEYHQQGLHHGDILLGKPIDIEECKKFLGNTLTVIHKENVTTRRLQELNPKGIVLKTDDPNYPNMQLKTDDIIEIWLIEAAYSKYLNPPSMLEERVLKLEKEMLKLKGQ